MAAGTVSLQYRLGLFAKRIGCLAPGMLRHGEPTGQEQESQVSHVHPHRRRLHDRDVILGESGATPLAHQKSQAAISSCSFRLHQPDGFTDPSLTRRVGAVESRMLIWRDHM